MTMLTNDQKETLRQQLLAMRVALEERMRLAAQETQPVSLDQPIGRLTRMDAIQQQQMALGQLQRVEQERQQIDAALRRLEQDTLGRCLRCQELISYDRLTIRPTTTLCYECQGELETRNRR